MFEDSASIDEGGNDDLAAEPSIGGEVEAGGCDCAIVCFVSAPFVILVSSLSLSVSFSSS